MGLSASQARLLTLTTRISDLELQAQQISNEKIRLSSDTEKITSKYSNSLNQQKFRLLNDISTSGTYNYIDMTYNSLTGSGSPLLNQYAVTDSRGNILVTAEMADAFESSSNADDFIEAISSNGDDIHYTNIYNKMCGGYKLIGEKESSDTNWMNAQIQSGNILLEQYKDGEWVSASWYANDDIVEEMDDSDVAQAESEYDAAMAKIKTKDSRYDLQLKNIDTEHSALQTEVDSVKKVIEKNIDRNFKIFDA